MHRPDTLTIKRLPASRCRQIRQHFFQRHLSARELTNSLHARRRHTFCAPLRHRGLTQSKVGSQRGQAPATVCGVKPSGEIHARNFSAREMFLQAGAS